MGQFNAVIKRENLPMNLPMLHRRVFFLLPLAKAKAGMKPAFTLSTKGVDSSRNDS